MCIRDRSCGESTGVSEGHTDVSYWAAAMRNPQFGLLVKLSECVMAGKFPIGERFTETDVYSFAGTRNVVLPIVKDQIERLGTAIVALELA